MITLSELFKDLGSFERGMEIIDEELRKEGVDIPRRPVHAFTKILTGGHSVDILNSPEGKAINAWFVNRYGDKLKVWLSIGKTIITVKKEPYLVRLPIIYGQPTINLREILLKWFEGITSGLIDKLTKDEAKIIFETVMDLYSSFDLIAMSFSEENIPTDLEASVDYILAARPDYGLSKWSSLQALEKALKLFISRKGQQPPRSGKTGHDLQLLAQLAENLGLPGLDGRLLLAVICTAGIRYG